MCQAISLVSRPLNEDESWVYFHNLYGRQNRNSYSNDSHTHISDSAAKECSLLRADVKRKEATKGYARADDIVNKWEWNPFTGRLVRDQKNCKIDDKEVMSNFVKTLEPAKVIGTKVQLKPTGFYNGTWRCYYCKGRGWILLNVDVPKSCIPAKFRKASIVNATIYRKPHGGWSFKDLSIG